jgi:hypothetical protein
MEFLAECNPRGEVVMKKSGYHITSTVNGTPQKVVVPAKTTVLELYSDTPWTCKLYADDSMSKPCEPKIVGMRCGDLISKFREAGASFRPKVWSSNNTDLDFSRQPEQDDE